MTDDATEEVRRLEGCVNDLTSILALPAIWSGRDAAHLVSTLLDALHRMLRLDFVYARLSEEGGDPAIEVVRASAQSGPGAGPREVGAALARSWTGGVLSAVARVPNPVGDGEVSIVPFRLGLEGDAGVLVAGSGRGDFPTRTEMLVLRVAANQAGIGLREARVLSAHRRERRRAEDDRLALASLIEHSSDFIGMATPEGQVFFVNPAGQRLVGLDGEDEVRTTRMVDYVPEEDRARVETYILPTILEAGRWEGETRFRNFRTGTTIPMLHNAFVVRDPHSGRPLALATISRDITERKRAEENLRESERRFRMLAEAIPHQVWSCLPDGSVNYGNQRWMDYSGLTMDQSQGYGWTSRVHPADMEAVLMAWREAKAQEKPHYEVEKRLRGSDGRYRRFLSRAVPVYDEQGKILQWFGTYTDIEDRRQAEEALRAAQAELAHVSRLTIMGELTASLAHELNQPLAAVVSNGGACLRWLDRGEPNLEEAMSAVRRMIRDADRAADVIAHVRAMLRSSGAEKVWLDVTGVIREVLVLAQPEIQRHRIVMREALAEDLPPVWGDRVQLQQVLLNLIVNGVEAMADVEGRDRALAIRSEHGKVDQGPGVLVSVQDAGVGVAPENLDRLFDAFYSTKSDGLGLGLSISRSIIQRHGGRLWATANEGPGTTLQFVLPA
jgi:PAS domain S-box-containing protein